MSRPKEKYPMIPEAVYWEKVRKSEAYTGFVLYDSGQIVFALPEVVVETKAIGDKINRFTNYLMLSTIKYREQPVSWEAARDAIRVDDQLDMKIRMKLMEEELNRGKGKAAAKIKFRSFIERRLADVQAQELKNLLQGTKNDRWANLKSAYQQLLIQIDKDEVYTNSIPAEIVLAQETKDYCLCWHLNTMTRNAGHFKTDQEYMAEELRGREQLDPVGVAMAQQPVIKAIAVGGVAATMTPLLYSGKASLISTEMWALKGSVSAVSQAYFQGDIREISLTAVAGDAIFTPGVGAFIGSAFEYRPFSEKQKLYVVGYNKKWQNFAVDFGTSYYFGKQNSMLNNKAISPLKNGHSSMYYIISGSSEGFHIFSSTMFSYFGNEKLKENSNEKK